MTIAENKNNKFSVRSLIITGKDNSELSLMGMLHKDKVFHLKLRQKWIVENHKEIERLKATNNIEVSNNISKLYTVNKNLKIAIEKIKFSTIIDRQPKIFDSLEYQEYFNSFKQPEVKSDWDLLNEINLRNPSLFAEFTVEFLKGQKTSVAIKYLKEVADNHLLVISQSILD